MDRPAARIWTLNTSGSAKTSVDHATVITSVSGSRQPSHQSGHPSNARRSRRTQALSAPVAIARRGQSACTPQEPVPEESLGTRRVPPTAMRIGITWNQSTLHTSRRPSRPPQRDRSRPRRGPTHRRGTSAPTPDPTLFEKSLVTRRVPPAPMRIGITCEQTPPPRGNTTRPTGNLDPGTNATRNSSGNRRSPDDWAHVGHADRERPPPRPTSSL